MSCSGHHFSVHSPDCRAHMSIQSNRPIQVDATPGSSVVGEVSESYDGASGGGQMIRWSSADRQTPQSDSSLRIESFNRSPQQHEQYQQLSSAQQRVMGSGGGNINVVDHYNADTATGHKMLVDGGDNYTLVILNCSPHPTDGDESSITCREGASSSRCCDCQSRCHCQTELIVRQQIEHDHTCQHATSRQQHHLLNHFADSGSIADRSASQTTTASRQDTTAGQHSADYRQLQNEEHFNKQREYQQQQYLPDSDWPVQRQQIRPVQQHQVSRTHEEFIYNTANRNNYNSQSTRRSPQNMSQEQEQSRYGSNWPPDQTTRENVYDQNTTTTTTTTTTSTTGTATNVAYPDSFRQVQHAQNSPPRQDQPANVVDQSQQPQQPKLRARPGMRIVKRWNWNQAQFVEEEVPDIQITEAQSGQQRELASSSNASKQTAPRSTDVWHQEIQNISSILSPTPAREYDPSWLAYRIPDEQSVQADPLYRDLMFELQRLEDGVSQTQPEPVITPENFQRPVFGQPITPQNVEVNEYESVEFICRLIPISDPSMRCEWTVNGRPLLESSRILSEHEFGVVRLLIKRCEAEDSGLYQCKAVNLLGEATSTATLKVQAKGKIQYETLNPAGLDKIRQLENPKAVDYVEEQIVQQPPKFLTHITDYVEKNEGESVHFECCLAPVDDPELKTEWFFNGRPLETGSRFHTIDDFGFIVLDIDWLYPRDTGEYVCMATNKFGTDITRTVLRVRPDKNIVLDSQLDNADVTIDKLRQLEFPDVAPEVIVEEPNKPAYFVQQLRSANNKRQFVEGDNVHFEARVGPATDGNLTVEWFHNDKPLISGHRFKPTFDFGHILLDILYVYAEDSGVYKCVAKNQLGEDSSQFEICVSGKPSLVYQSQLPKEMVGGVQKITEMEAMWNRPPDPEEEEAPLERMAPEFVLTPQPCTAFEGSCARFCCRLSANPRPIVKWFINDQLVVSGSRYKLTHDGMYHLIIPKCQLTDAGKITVRARNLLGECSSETQLKVKRKVDDYRGVLKNSPNPWYDEQTLKVYRRQREQDDDDDNDDYEEFLQKFQEKRQQLQEQAIRQQQQLNPNRLHIATELQSTSPIANQLIGYMEPETPDINLLVSSTSSSAFMQTGGAGQRSPLIEPGDLHPVVVEQQAIMAPAPSTIQRAMSKKDEKVAEVSFDQLGATSVAAASGRARASSVASSQQDLNRIDLTDKSQQDQSRRVFGLTSSRGKIQLPGHERTHSEFELQQQQRNQDDHLSKQKRTNISVSSRDLRQPPPPSPESHEHGKEIHSHTHKQTQVERRANKEITREIIEKEIFEQEHSGFTKDNVLVRAGSQERARSATPASSVDSRVFIQVQQHHQPQESRESNRSPFGSQHQQQQQNDILIEDYMIPPEFIQKIQPCQAIDGDEARFECEFKGDPQPNITWYRESKLIKPSNLYTIETDFNANKSTLIIKRVALNSNAVYTVKAENVAGSAKSSANLVVEPHPLPQISRGGLARQIDTAAHIDKQQVTTTETFTDVRGASDDMSQLGTTTLLSESSGGQLTPDSAQKVVKSVRTRRLSPDQLASRIRASPEGFVAPTFLHTLHETAIRPGDLARLDARLIGSSPLEVRWLKDGQRIRADKSHKMLLEGDLYTLLILECTPRDEGMYECVAVNSVGEARCSASLTVSPDAGRSSVSGASGRDAIGALTSSAHFSTGGQSSSYVTSSTTATSQQSSSTSSSAGGHKTHFGLTKQPHHSLKSEYTSLSTSLSDQQQQQQILGEINSIPKLIKRLENQQVFEGKSVTLRCQISAFPKAEIFWYKHGDKLIKPSKYFRIFKDNDETHCLRILETFPEDQGEYKCVARSQNGFVETSATVTVLPSSPK